MKYEYISDKKLKQLQTLWKNRKGVIVSNVTKKKISNTLKGRKLSKQHIQNIIQSQLGDKHWKWKPEYSEKLLKSGYVKIKIKYKWLYKHRYIMEQHLNRKLYSNELIHHLDNDTTNNKIDNLKLTTYSKHLKIYHNDTGKNTRFPYNNRHKRTTTASKKL